MGKREYLGELEERTLTAVLRLRDSAYGASIWRELEDSGRRVSIGAVYTTLERLEESGMVSSWLGEATPERGGRAKKFFKLEGEGMKALREARRIDERMWHGLEALGVKS